MHQKAEVMIVLNTRSKRVVKRILFTFDLLPSFFSSFLYENHTTKNIIEKKIINKKIHINKLEWNFYAMVP